MQSPTDRRPRRAQAAGPTRDSSPAPARAEARHSPAPAASLRGAGLRFGDRTVWSGLDLDVQPGEFIAVLGPNGAGKSSLLNVLLGVQRLSTGSATVAGAPARRGRRRIGYIPQHTTLGPDVTVRGRDLVGFGLDGHRWGLGLRHRRERAARVDAALEAVGARDGARTAFGLLSGGEQQRLRVAQALVGRPELLLCDEPLASLDIAHQGLVAELIDRPRRDGGAAVLFVTHDVNPVLPLVDRIVYIARGQVIVGTPEDVLTSEVLSGLYRTHVDVLRAHGRVVVLAPGAHARRQR